MLTLPYFIKAEIWKEEESNSFSVRYYLNKREYLEDYFQNHAKKMRKEAVAKFKNDFTAKRRILVLI